MIIYVVIFSHIYIVSELRCKTLLYLIFFYNDECYVELKNILFSLTATKSSYIIKFNKISYHIQETLFIIIVLFLVLYIVDMSNMDYFLCLGAPIVNSCAKDPLHLFK